MSLPIIQTIQNNINSLNSSKLDIKNAVNTDYDFIANEQIESYPSLIKQGIAHYKNRVPHATKEGTDLNFDAVPLKFENMTIKGDTSQESTNGVQLLDISDAVNGYFVNNDGAVNTANTGFHTQKYIDVSGISTIYGRFEALSNIRISRFWMQEYDENYNSLQRTILGIYDVIFTSGEVKKYSKNLLTNTKYIRLSSYSLQELDNGTYVDKTPTKDYWNDLVKATISFTDVDIYEPYTGGQPSPNPDYPQPIHVVTGNNSIGVQGKNLFDISKFIQGVWNDAAANINKTRVVGWLTPIKLGESYTITKYNDNYDFACGVSTHGYRTAESTTTDDSGWQTGNSYTITASQNGYVWLQIRKKTAQNITPSELVATDFQLEQGSTASSYEPYYHADYPINLGNIELCKIGDYQDYLYKENGNWYIQKNTGKTILGKPTTGNLVTNYAYNYFSYRGEPSGIYPGTNIICSHFIGAYNITDMRTKAQYNNSVYWGSLNTFVRVDKFNTVEEYINALSANDITIIGRARTPTTTQITDETLIAQLNAIDKAKGVDGTTIITIDSDDLKPILNFTAYLKEVE